MTTRVIVAGTRTFDDYFFLREKLNHLLRLVPRDDIEIISGCAVGADSLGEKYAETYGYKVTRFPADWERLGKRAGYIRNAEMAKYAGEKGKCVVFWDGVSKGSRHMIDLAKKHGLEVRVIRYK